MLAYMETCFYLCPRKFTSCERSSRQVQPFRPVVKMKVRVSKVFAKFISDTCRERGIEARACVCSFTGRNQINEYQYTVGDVWDAYANNDLDSQGNLCAICVTWPEDYYALPRYVTTSDLHREFRSRGVRNWDELKDMVCDMFEI